MDIYSIHLGDTALWAHFIYWPILLLALYKTPLGNADTKRFEQYPVRDLRHRVYVMASKDSDGRWPEHTLAGHDGTDADVSLAGCDAESGIDPARHHPDLSG